jgi:hypothetical protein
VWRSGVLLLIGAAMNLGIAWVCALWVPLDARTGVWYDMKIPADVIGEIEAARSELGLPEVWKECVGASDTGIGVSLFGFIDLSRAYQMPTKSSPLRLVYVVRAGWPWRCVSCRFQRGLSGKKECEDRWYGGFDAPPWAGARDLTSESTLGVTAWANWFPSDQRPLPYRPEWTGLVGGSVFFAALLSMIWVPQVIRHEFRRRRAACVECGYDLAGLPTCPECGRRIRSMH